MSLSTLAPVSRNFPVIRHGLYPHTVLATHEPELGLAIHAHIGSQWAGLVSDSESALD